jgi:hypothetical protein
MAKLLNSYQYNTINRKALTFDAEIVSNTANSKMQVTEGDNITQLIDTQGLESEKSAAGKMGMLMSMINAAYSQALCKLNDRYEVICHAESIPTSFSVPDNANTIIPFTTLVYTPATGSYSPPTGFRVARSGYYDVDVMFQNYNLTTPVVRVFLVIGNTVSWYGVGDVVMGTEQMRVQGSMKIWCEKDDYIRAGLFHQAGVTILFNTLAHPGAGGYISISYAGSEKAASH